MSTKDLKARKLDKDYVVMNPKGKSEIWAAKDFWEMAFNPKHRKNTKDMGYLVSEYEFTEDWSSWENHPNGDELVVCLAGAMTFVMETSKGLEKVRLKAGRYVIVPKNTWHTAKVREGAKALFVTWGSGTKHREV